MSEWLRWVHMSCAGLSLVGFVIRGWWMLQQNPLLHAKLTKSLPHIIDTLLLLSAIGLLLTYSLNPLGQPWLIAKILALLIYIGLGTVALKRGSTRRQRALAWVAALGVFAYILGTAHYKTPWSFAVLL